MKRGACGCCEPPEALTPLEVQNRPALRAIAYRIGTHSSFLRTMLEAISRTPELADLRTRERDDPAIALLDLWATVADVLAFYQERIANECFLRTLRRRDSLLRLARLIDYELRPGAAATVDVAFALEEGRRVAIPRGLRIQSVPGQDQDPQKFETLEALAADARLNRLRVVAAPRGAEPLAMGSRSGWLAPGPAALDVARGLAPGDTLLLFGTGPGAELEDLEVEEVLELEDRIRLSWASPIRGSGWSLTTRVFERRRLLHPFGWNAPQSYMRPVEDSTVAGGIKWELVNLVPDFPGGALLLDATYEDVAVGTRFLLAVEGVENVLLTVTAVGQAHGTLGPLSETVTRIETDPPAPAIADLRLASLHELDGPPLCFWGYEYGAALPSARVYLAGRRVDAETIELERRIGSGGIEPGLQIAVEEIELGRRVLLCDGASEPVLGEVRAVSLHGDDVSFGPTPADPHTAEELQLVAATAETRTALVSSEHESEGPLTHPAPELRVRIGELGPHALALGGGIVDLATARTALEAGLQGADPHAAFADARVEVFDRRLVVVPGIPDAKVRVQPTETDPSTAVELGLDPERSGLERVLVTPLPAPFPVLTAPTPELTATIGPIGPLRLSLAGVPATAAALAQLLEAALQAADPAPSFRYARVFSQSPRLLVVPGRVGVADEDYLVLSLDTDGGSGTDPRSTALLGNVARASHGESVKDEILGSGDAADAFATFTLKRAPLTHVPTATPGGLESSLRVLVDGVAWQEVASLYGQPSTAQSFVTRAADDGAVTLRFGDGRSGASVPTGRDNVRAFYRTGVGLAGRVAAGTLKTLLDRPIGLRSSTNPRAAEGGADPEALEDARENAPATVRTFGRAVSLQDFEDLARSFAEVAKARATWVWQGLSRAVHVTLAGHEAATFSLEALRRIHQALDLGRDPNHPLLLDNFVRIPIQVAATLHVAPTHVADEVRAEGLAALLEALSFETLRFGQPVHLSDLYAVLQAVPGVEHARVELLQFKDQTPAFLASRGADDRPVQEHLRIYPALAQPGPPAAVAPAEQAWLESPTHDVTLQSVGGLAP